MKIHCSHSNGDKQVLSRIRNIPNRALILPICCFLAIFCQFNTENILASDGNPKIEKDAVSKSHLTLEEAINTALRANRDILVSGRGVQDRHLGLAKARTDFNLKIFPNASAGVTSYESDTRETIGAGLSFNKKLFSGLKVSVEPKASKSESHYESSVSLFLEKPLLRGSGKAVVLDPVYAAEYSIRSTERAYYQTRVNTVLKTVSQFHEIARQHGQKNFLPLFRQSQNH